MVFVQLKNHNMVHRNSANYFVFLVDLEKVVNQVPQEVQ